MRQAQRFLRLFPDWGRYGLSAYYARDETDVDDLARDQLERFSHMAIFDLVQLEDGGFEVVPTFRTPHVTIAFAGDLQKRLDHLGALVKEHLRNPYHEQEPAAPSDEDEDDER
jgi:hypothetical protein